MKTLVTVFALLAIVELGYVGVQRLRRSDPLESLQEAALSSDYSSAFWIEERTRKSDLWREALRLCSDSGADQAVSPNCQIVATVAADSGIRRASGRPRIADPGSRSFDSAAPVPEIPNGLTGHGARGVPGGFSSRSREAPASAGSR